MNRVNSGVGYAIPSNQIRNFLPEMMKGGQSGKIHHGMIGGLQLHDGNTQGQGARVTSVRNGSAADTAGLRREDVIVEVNGYAIFNRERYLGVIGTYPEKTEVKLKVKRGDETADLKATLERFNPLEGLGIQMPSRPEPARPKGSGYLGVYVEEESGAIVVKDVTPDSPADRGGLKAGDVILRADGRRVQNRPDLNARVWQRKPGETIKIVIRRDGKEETVEVQLGKHPNDE
jgi:serine protease Do